MMKKFFRITVPVLSAILFFALAGCGSEPPPGDGTPEPPALNGSFILEGYGGFTFNGDGQTVEVKARKELSDTTGLPEGNYAAAYVFLFDGGLWRYDKADTMRIIVGDSTYSISTVPGGTDQNRIELLSSDGNSLAFKKSE